MSEPQILVHADASHLAKAVATRLISKLTNSCAVAGHASLVLTGGTIGIQVLAEIAAAPGRTAVDWHSLDIWWGDEAFLPAGDPARVETQARAALLDHVDVSDGCVHPMPSLHGDDGDDPDAAAATYAAQLMSAADDDMQVPVPSFDVLLLGIGPDAHIASLFPGMPALKEEARTVVAVRDAPKPPPTRISLTLPAIRSAREVWLVASGTDQADAIRLALSSASPLHVPAAGARGQRQTVFLMDRDAAQYVSE